VEFGDRFERHRWSWEELKDYFAQLTVRTTEEALASRASVEKSEL
jgi:hypothetical protein